MRHLSILIAVLPLLTSACSKTALGAQAIATTPPSERSRAQVSAETIPHESASEPVALPDTARTTANAPDEDQAESQCSVDVAASHLSWRVAPATCGPPTGADHELGS
jgi:hypothetical protein